LAAIQAHLYVARNASSDSERLQAMDQAQLGVERGIRLVSQMLTLARLDPQQARPDMQTAELRDIAQNVCAELFPIAMRRQQTLELVATTDSTRVMGNADLLHRLMSNLVDNAIRYSPPEGDITLEIKSGPKGLRLTVCDSGPGIPEHQRDKVFNRFCRLSDQSVQGNGLGLSICVCIAELHQAHISLDHGPNGRGLAVYVDFIAID
jgi:signal transduction histidine kinase